MTVRSSGGSSVAVGRGDRTRKQTGKDAGGKAKNKAIPTRAGRRQKSARADLPPNENIRKHADEVYGDTEIPERKE